MERDAPPLKRDDMKRHEDDYVFVLNAAATSSNDSKKDENTGKKAVGERGGVESTSSSSTSSFFSVEEAPANIPFLPLDASTEITKHGGYTEAVKSAQAFLDSRLESYSQYKRMTIDENKVEELSKTLLSPLQNTQLEINEKVESTSVPAKLQITTEALNVNSKGSDVSRQRSKRSVLGLGWREVLHIDSTSRNLLRKLEMDGVLYTPHDTTYTVKYFQPVAPNGDCLFLSIEQLLLQSTDCEPKTTSQIRQEAIHSFWTRFQRCPVTEQEKINRTIQNLYLPDLKHGWGVSPIQTRRYVVPLVDRDLLIAKIYELQDQGYSWNKAAEIIYGREAKPVVDAATYCQYMLVGHCREGEENSHFLVALHYSNAGLVSIDNDPDNKHVSWGDDIVLEEIATLYQRDIFVVLIGGGKMFFLPHSPRRGDGRNGSQGLSPWFLLMRSTGTERGGDHYEPMYCERIRGDASPSLTSIGD